MTTDLALYYITLPNEASAATLARRLLEERRIACANVLPGMRSFYRWEGEVREEAEAVLIVKAPRAQGDALIARIADLHPYDVPCILMLPVGSGHAPFMEWVTQQCLAK